MHPKSIWQLDGKQYIYYFPYMSKVTRAKVGVWEVVYNGGVERVRLSNTSLITFVGANERTGDLPLLFIVEAARSRTAIMICKTHQRQPALIVAGGANAKEDVLSAQILHRENEKQSAYIARTLIAECFSARQELVARPVTIETKLSATRTVKAAMQIEAHATLDYWQRYYQSLGLNGVSRRAKHPVNDALNALSRYQSGILLRWCLVHGLSPIHGFLHRRSTYEALIYDLMEPYRVYLEMAVKHAVAEVGTEAQSSDMIDAATKAYKLLMDEQVLIEPTNQRVYRRAMLQGPVIALRHYLTKRMKRFLPPRETDNKQGRPFKCSYRVPGEIK